MGSIHQVIMRFFKENPHRSIHGQDLAQNGALVFDLVEKLTNSMPQFSAKQLLLDFVERKNQKLKDDWHILLQFEKHETTVQVSSYTRQIFFTLTKKEAFTHQDYSLFACQISDFLISNNALRD